MRQGSVLLGTFLAVTLPALGLAAGRATAGEPSAAATIPPSAFQPVATQRPTMAAGNAAAAVNPEILVELGPSATAPAPRPEPAIPANRPVVVTVAPPKPVAPAAGSGTPSVADARAYALSRIGATQFSCLDALWQRESRWNPYAYNATSGAYGIPQALPGDKMATFGADWRTNPLTQVRWGLSYIASVYGTACVAWSHSQRDGWY